MRRSSASRRGDARRSLDRSDRELARCHGRTICELAGSENRPLAAVIVGVEEGSVLVRHTDMCPNWTAPGGASEPGGSVVVETALRDRMGTRSHCNIR